MIKLRLKVDQVTYAILQRMAREAGISDEDMAKAAIYSVIGGYLQDRKEQPVQGNAPVSGG